MARHFFGMSPADFALQAVGSQLILQPGAAGTAWDAKSAGTQLTDLLDINASATAAVTADADGRVGFYGPDGTPFGPNRLWVDFGFGRFLLQAMDLGDQVDAKLDLAGGVIAGRLDVNGGLFVGGEEITAGGGGGGTEPTYQGAVHGMFIGYDDGYPFNTGDLDAYEIANSLVVRICHEFGDATQWDWFADGTNFKHWNAWVGRNPIRRFSYSAPLISAQNPNDYTGLNAGTYDSYFTRLGVAFQKYPNLRNSIIRLGWEFNGNTFPWFIGNNATNAQVTAYKSGFNRAAGLIRAQAPNVQFEWCPNLHPDAANRTFADLYPGDTYVDYIGAAVYDYYWPGGSPTQLQRETWMLTGNNGFNGLNDLAALATARGKPLALTEWGLVPTTTQSGGGDRPAFITFMLNWMRDHNAAYTIYNNVSATWDSRLNTYPNAKAAYIDRLSGGILSL